MRDFGKSDQLGRFENGEPESIDLGRANTGKAVLKPGREWSGHATPSTKTKNCEAPRS